MKKGTFASFCSCAVLAASLCVDVFGMHPGEDQGGNSEYEKIKKCLQDVEDLKKYVSEVGNEYEKCLGKFSLGGISGNEDWLEVLRNSKVSSADYESLIELLKEGKWENILLKGRINRNGLFGAPTMSVLSQNAGVCEFLAEIIHVVCDGFSKWCLEDNKRNQFPIPEGMTLKDAMDTVLDFLNHAMIFLGGNNTSGSYYSISNGVDWKWLLPMQPLFTNPYILTSLLVNCGCVLSPAPGSNIAAEKEKETRIKEEEQRLMKEEAARIREEEQKKMEEEEEASMNNVEEQQKLKDNEEEEEIEEGEALGNARKQQMSREGNEENERKEEEDSMNNVEEQQKEKLRKENEARKKKEEEEQKEKLRKENEARIREEEARKKKEEEQKKLREEEARKKKEEEQRLMKENEEREEDSTKPCDGSGYPIKGANETSVKFAIRVKEFMENHPDYKKREDREKIDEIKKDNLRGFSSISIGERRDSYETKQQPQGQQVPSQVSQPVVPKVISVVPKMMHPLPEVPQVPQVPQVASQVPSVPKVISVVPKMMHLLPKVPSLPQVASKVPAVSKVIPPSLPKMMHPLPEVTTKAQFNEVK
jgi:hypothetical protein